MAKGKMKFGTNESVRENANEAKNKACVVDYPWIEWHCLRCLRKRLLTSLKRLADCQTMPGEEKLSAMIDIRNNMDVNKSLRNNDYTDAIDKMIAYEKNKLDEKKIECENKKSIQAASNLLLPSDLQKLALDDKEGDLAGVIKAFMISTKNKKGNHIYTGDYKTLAKWICETIILKNGQKLNYNTIAKGLSANEKSN